MQWIRVDPDPDPKRCFKYLFMIFFGYHIYLLNGQVYFDGSSVFNVKGTDHFFMQNQKESTDSKKPL